MERSNIGSWLVPAAALLLSGTESLRVAPKEADFHRENFLPPGATLRLVGVEGQRAALNRWPAAGGLCGTQLFCVCFTF